MATMHPIYEGSDDERSDTAHPALPPMRSCSSATTQPARASLTMLSRRVSFTSGNQRKSTSRQSESIEEDYDDSSVETMTSASLYSLHNHKPKKEPSFTDYLFCQASFNDLIEEVKGTWGDATSAVDQIVHAFVISDEDIDCVSEQIEIAERDIEVHVVQAIRNIGLQKC